MTAMDKRAHIEALQHRASNPASSAWVRANAGSGKTHVLAQRVVRLLLDGVDPSRILCLTFTKAAAANMSSRIFSMLGKWAVLDDKDLREAIRGTGAGEGPRLDVARKLFARAIETPGGLKIQTIHAFCERVLHLFPFEANVPASFEALDDENKALLMRDARHHVLAEAMKVPNSLQGRALTRVAGEASGMTFEALLVEALSCREAMANASRLQSDGYSKALSRALGLAADEDEDGVVRAILEDGPGAAKWDALAIELHNSGGNDAKMAAHIRAALEGADANDKVEKLKRVFYTNDGDLRKDRKGWLVKQALGPAINQALFDERERVAPLYEKHKSARLVADSVALHVLADAVIDRYTKLKQARGLLDFDDLIERTRTLLGRADTPGWVLYKLDAGIDHVLLDEAQDTSREQWDIVRNLVGEFFTDPDSRARSRTFFAVGDEKQSIFSFQGAEPRAFDENAKDFEKNIKASGLGFEPVKLQVSFRSCATVLDSVDAVFALKENYTGLSFGDDVQPVHEAWKTGVPGLVEIWSPVKGETAREPEDWAMPLDALPASAPAHLLAQRIADKISALIDPARREAVHEEKNGQIVKREVRAGDIMILVRRRNAFFDAVIRALKMKGVRVAGADRLKLMEHIAVMDLIAAGRAALLPQDDFSLACAVKSPLFGLDDDDLLALAPGRKGHLIDAMLASSNMRHRESAETMLRWGKAARALSPFRFYAQILGADGGRKSMIGRLGQEAGDAIDEFMRLALDWEHREAASLTAFLLDVQGAELEVKRDMEAAGEAVRVMTVHAAKGLEAKIVFMPDTCAAPSGQHAPHLVTIDSDGGELPLWRKTTKTDPDAVRTLLQQKTAAEEEEYRRLLYVAMTRAEERIYICGYHGSRAPSASCWHNMIHGALAARAVEAAAPWGEETILRIGEGALLDRPAEAAAPAQRIVAPAWLSQPAPVEAPPAPPIRPSRALASADRFDDEASPQFEARRFALLEGSLSHALLQYLPEIEPDLRAAAATRYLDRRGGELAAADRQRIARDVLALMADSELAPLFAPDARREAAIAGQVALPGGRVVPISGRIDCLAQTGDEVILADFKSGKPRPGGGETYVAQMALYRAALQPLFAGKSIRALLIWTSGPQVDVISPGAMDAALVKLAHTSA